MRINALYVIFACQFVNRGSALIPSVHCPVRCTRFFQKNPVPAIAKHIHARSTTIAGGGISGIRATASQHAPAPSADPEYPWSFTGRVWFQPALVRTPAPNAVAPGITPLSLFGWTLGGTVCLEYDESPAGRYLEVVQMGALVASDGGGVGQWGTRLWVSTAPAEELCRAVWGVPAELRPIRFAPRCTTLPPPTSHSDGTTFSHLLAPRNVRSLFGPFLHRLVVATKAEPALFWSEALRFPEVLRFPDSESQRFAQRARLPCRNVHTLLPAISYRRVFVRFDQRRR
jgi:hypothetical protein